jgi:hypothetical protein
VPWPPVLFVEVTPALPGMVRDVDVRDQRRGLPGGDRVLEHALGGTDVRKRTRTSVPHEAIVLDQAVVGPTGEGEDRQLKRVERRHLKQGGVGQALLDGRAVEPVEVVAYEDVARTHPADKLAMCPFEPRATFAFPDAFLALSAGGHCMEDAVAA